MGTEISFLRTWAKLCHDTVAHMLPVNYIDALHVGYSVPDGQPPLKTTEGQVVHRILVRHEDKMPLDG